MKPLLEGAVQDMLQAAAQGLFTRGQEDIGRDGSIFPALATLDGQGET